MTCRLALAKKALEWVEAWAHFASELVGGSRVSSPYLVNELRMKFKSVMSVGVRGIQGIWQASALIEGC